MPACHSELVIWAASSAIHAAIRRSDARGARLRGKAARGEPDAQLGKVEAFVSLGPSLTGIFRRARPGPRATWASECNRTLRV
eukprot:695797-Hanusia_phi.AAC.1